MTVRSRKAGAQATMRLGKGQSEMRMLGEDVNSEVLDAGVANWDRSTSKAFHVNSVLLPMIQTRGHRQEANEMESVDPRNFISNFGSQQQYFTRSSTPANVEDGGWNMAFVGAEGAPGSHCGADNKLCIHTYVTEDETTVSAEKPFTENEYQGLNSLRVPLVQFQSRGHIHEFTTRTVGFESVYVASADVDTADSRLADGLDVVLALGIYNLSSLQITAANQMLLGLGLATLSPTNGTAVIQIANVPDVRVAGVLIQVWSGPTEAPLEWGNGAYAGDASNPGSLHDVFMRVGGPTVPMKSDCA